MEAQPDESGTQAEENAGLLLKKVATLIEEQLDSVSTKDAIEGLMAKVLGVADVKQIVSESQQVMEIDDETDLQAAAVFDFSEWMQSSGLSVSQIDNDQPSELLRKSLEDQFSLPIAAITSPSGELELGMTQDIKILDLAYKSRRKLQS